MRRRDVAAGVRDRARCRHRCGALSVAHRDLCPIGHLARSGSIEARSSAEKSHASAAIPVYTWSSCSTSAGSRGGPTRLGRVAATSPEDRRVRSQRRRRRDVLSVTFANCTASLTGCVWERSKLGAQPTKLHASVITGIAPVDTWSSSSTYTVITRRAIEARTHRSDVAGGDRVRSRCRHHRAVLSVHLREQHRVVHEVHTETSDPESKTEGKIKGMPLI
jgi:hypothetical protein